MKVLLLTNANDAFALLGEYAGLYNDNGGDSGGPCWLPNATEDDIPEELMQDVIDQQCGEIVEVKRFDDESLGAFLNMSPFAIDEKGYVIREALTARLASEGMGWAHFGAYGAMDSTWVVLQQ